MASLASPVTFTLRSGTPFAPVANSTTAALGVDAIVYVVPVFYGDDNAGADQLASDEYCYPNITAISGALATYFNLYKTVSLGGATTGSAISCVATLVTGPINLDGSAQYYGIKLNPASDLTAASFYDLQYTLTLPATSAAVSGGGGE